MGACTIRDKQTVELCISNEMYVYRIICVNRSYDDFENDSQRKCQRNFAATTPNELSLSSEKQKPKFNQCQPRVVEVAVNIEHAEYPTLRIYIYIYFRMVFSCLW